MTDAQGSLTHHPSTRGFRLFGGGGGFPQYKGIKPRVLGMPVSALPLSFPTSVSSLLTVSSVGKSLSLTCRGKGRVSIYDALLSSVQDSNMPTQCLAEQLGKTHKAFIMECTEQKAKFVPRTSLPPTDGCSCHNTATAVAALGGFLYILAEYHPDNGEPHPPTPSPESDYQDGASVPEVQRIGRPLSISS